MRFRTLLLWRRIIALMAIAFFVWAFVPTLAAVLVNINGDRINLSGGEKNNSFTVDINASAKLHLLYGPQTLINLVYSIDGQIYHAQVWTDPERHLRDDGEYEIYPASPRSFDILVWKRLPSYPIVILPGSGHFARTIPLWIMTTALILLFLCVQRSMSVRLRLVNSSPLPVNLHGNGV